MHAQDRLLWSTQYIIRKIPMNKLIKTETNIRPLCLYLSPFFLRNVLVDNFIFLGYNHHIKFNKINLYF